MLSLANVSHPFNVTLCKSVSPDFLRDMFRQRRVDGGVASEVVAASYFSCQSPQVVERHLNSRTGQHFGPGQRVEVGGHFLVEAALQNSQNFLKILQFNI